ncbi:tetratricopeptide repeat protein 39B-like [Mucor ambiguus]|uniref:Tetratricopeptide repeat protein 39B-like n=1 Tax=Mucor ambiguus TaxID=91626 RepID=A0A0C9MVC0_9FUNG|nr:tetratricopeptide repeat protein 39B-like [Mucor ambiguus]
MAKGANKKTAWKGIQKKASDADRPASIASQDSRKTVESKDDSKKSKEVVTRSRSSSLTSDNFEDALSEEEEDEEEDEDDDYFQDEDLEEEKKKKEVEKMKEMAIAQDKKRSTSAKKEEFEKEEPQEAVAEEEPVKKTPSRMSFILPALQNHGFSDEDDDDISLKDPNETARQDDIKDEGEKEDQEKHEVGSSSSSSDLIAEIEALEVASTPITATAPKPAVAAESPVVEKAVVSEKPTTYEPIPAERPYVPPTPAAVVPESKVDTPLETVKQSIPDEIHTVKGVSEHKDESKATPTIVAASTDEIPAVIPTDIATEEIQLDTPAVVKDIAQQGEEKSTAANHIDDVSDSMQQTTARSSDDASDATPSGELEATSNQEETVPQKPVFNHLAAILPAVEESVKNVTTEKPKVIVDNDAHILPEDRDRAKYSREFEYPIEDPIDLDMFKDNVISIQAIDPKDIPVNNMKPYEQEKAGKLFRFMKAKSVFQTKASIDPLYALGLGAMAFIKAIMTYHDSDIEIAMSALATAYTIAKTQIDNTSFKKPFKDTVSQYFTSLLSSNNTGLPTNPPAMSMPNSSGGISDPNAFIPNGVLRAHVVKAECCLLMGVLQMTQESVVGYLKCGLNIRRAYNSYGIVWQEYKRMGQEYTKYMDRDTVSAIQFGIGAVHLILSSMPPKILKIFSALGWKSDKQLGFALLKLLLAYYSVLTAFAPQLYSKDMMSPAIECLLDAQSNHPNSCFFLFFAARIARVARNLPLSTQSFTFAAESSRGEWAEVAMKQMSDYEIGFNLALELDWTGAASYFEQLSRENYWSPAFSKYFVGTCHEMMGQRTEAILAFAEVPALAEEPINGKKTYIDNYVLKKVAFFQKSGYQDMDFSLPALEILLVMNAFEHMEKESLEKCLDLVQHTLELIYEREKMEYNIRLRELVPITTPPDYYDQRAVLLLVKASVLNSLGRYDETIAHLNWILDHKECVKEENWVIPFTYWESGVTSWGLGNYKKSRKLWQLAMSCTKYDFEYRMAVRLSLSLSKCDDIGVPHIGSKEIKGSSTNGRKRMPILSTY